MSNLKQQLMLLEGKLAELEGNSSGIMNEDATKEMIKSQLRQQIAEIRQMIRESK
jgi:hypothetical protein